VPVAPLASRQNGVPFLVASGIVYEIIAANCSSPQTAELNAEKRAETLMKWANIGMAESLLFIVIAAWVDPQHAAAIICGGLLAAVLMYGSYVHAKAAGLKSAEEPTEQWS
jgi:heme A synthase